MQITAPTLRGAGAPAAMSWRTARSRRAPTSPPSRPLRAGLTSVRKGSPFSCRPAPEDAEFPFEPDRSRRYRGLHRIAALAEPPIGQDTRDKCLSLPENRQGSAEGMMGGE